MEPSDMIMPGNEVHQMEAMLELATEIGAGREAKACKWAVTICTLFPYPWFCPNGFFRKGFNEANWFTCCKPIHKQVGSYGELRSLIESYRPNQEEPNIKFNFLGFSTHQRSSESWIRDQIRYGSGVINVTSQVNENSSDLDQRALIGGLRLNQEELSCEPTCYGNLTHQGIRDNLNQTGIHYGLKVIEVLIQGILHLPYLKAHGFRRLQTRIWRPGEISKHSRGLDHDIEAFPKVLQCSSTQRNRRILLLLNLPYLDMFTLGAFKPQRPLSCLCCCDFKAHSRHLDIPKHHSFTPKLSRLKEVPFTKYGQIAQLSATALCLYFCNYSCDISRP